MVKSDDIAEKKSFSHAWRFIRVGGFDHVLLETGDDLAALERLDQKLWAALSCPTQGLEFDSATLDYIDTDGDGRIRAPEVIGALKWTISLIKNPDDLIRGAGELPLSAINDSLSEGRDILACAKEILANNGKKSAEAITLEDTADSSKVFVTAKFNGDGILPAIAAEDDAVGKVIEDIIVCMGSEQDRSGLPGITKEKADLFFSKARQYADWWNEAEKEASGILFLGESTPKAAEIFEAVRAKTDEYFIRCSLAAFDANATESLNPDQAQYEELSRKSLSASMDEIAAFPLAKVAARDSLPLSEGINPAWAERLSKFRDQAVRPVFGSEKDSLSAYEWVAIKEKFSAYRSWTGCQEGNPFEKIGLQRIREIIASQSEQIIAELIEKDKALESAANSVAALNKLIRYYRDIYTFLNNFVSFHDFYNPKKKAVFQTGTLYLDGRSCDLCIRVGDVAAHSTLAQLGGTYLVYCECTRKGSSEKIKIAAAFTEGDSDNLMVGRNGIFYDRQNRDWDATIVKIVEHPISIRQAFWSPYKRFARMVQEQIEKVASARDKSLDAGATGIITHVSAKAEAGKAAPVQPFDVGKFAGIFAALGLAVGAIGTAAASVITGFMGLEWWQMPLAFAGLMLLVSGPSMVIASLKLRQRNLSPILDACGWAVNTRARINIPFGSSLTTIAKLPEGSSRLLTDPFAEKTRPWRLYILILIMLAAAALLWQNGMIQKLSCF